MRKFAYVVSMVLLFPADLFRFTVDAWRYTLEWFGYCLFGRSEEQPCIFCRGLDLGHVPRRVSFRMKYRNLWLVRLLQPELVIQPAKDRCRPRIACMREGGYIRMPRYIPVLAVVLGGLWIAGGGAALWYSGTIPEDVRESIVAYFH